MKLISTIKSRYVGGQLGFIVSTGSGVPDTSRDFVPLLVGDYKWFFGGLRSKPRKLPYGGRTIGWCGSCQNWLSPDNPEWYVKRDARTGLGETRHFR
jgi:hypothetical protein